MAVNLARLERRTVVGAAVVVSPMAMPARRERLAPVPGQFPAMLAQPSRPVVPAATVATATAGTVVAVVVGTAVVAAVGLAGRATPVVARAAARPQR